LGGGSSNAATVLRALQELCASCAPVDELWELARSLGADVPYFLVGGTALGFGRGDEIIPLPELPSQELFLVLPPFQVATAEVFASLEELTADRLDPRIMALVQSEAPRWEALSVAVNDLEAVVLRRWPALEEGLAILEDAGASLARVSGSGATLYARFDDDPGEGLGHRFPEGWRLERVRTLSRAALARGRRSGGT
jgi:4-diphosphocytidyl-2-C-methyl-D-erythritol kinase